MDGCHGPVRPAGRTVAISDTGVAHSTDAGLKYDPGRGTVLGLARMFQGSVQCLPAAQRRNWKRMQHVHALP
jgi:hypothetical protein